MVWLFRFLTGYIKFRFSGGFCEDFINECYENAVEIKEISPLENGEFTALCSAKTYFLLHRVAYRHGGKVKVIKKIGIPFIFSGLKNRAGFFIGAVIFIFIISFLGAFVWNVEIVGCKEISELTLCEYLENNGLKCGAMWSAVNRKSLAWDMMSEFEKISYAHINKIGTTARVEINETREITAQADENKLKGVKAVRKEITVQACREQSKIKILSQKSYKTIEFFALKIPLYIKKSQGGIETVSEKFVEINDVKLPIGLSVTSITRLGGEKYELTDEQLRALAKKKLAVQAQKELDGFKIINSVINTEIDGDICTATGAYIIKYEE